MKKILAIIAMRSKTVNITALVAAIITICQQFGVVVQPELVTSIFVIVAILMRMVTESPVDQK